MFGAQLISFGATAVIYFTSLSIALSDTGEEILKFVHRIRNLETKREKYYLLPLFRDVYTQAKKFDPNLSKNIKIHIIDSMNINAYALGRKTVAVTKGAIDSLTEEELKGLIGHELGHIANGDTIALLLSTIGNGIFTILIIAAQTAVNIINAVIDRRGLAGVFMGFIKLCFSIVLFWFCYIGEFLLSINSRANEYAADEFAFKIGYGDDLVSALYLLQDMCISDNAKLGDRLKASHPHIAKRIGTLESMIDEEEQE